MTKVNEVLLNYSNGKLTADETNAKLKALGSEYRIDPTLSYVTDAEKEATVVGKTPADVTGFGLADIGLGSPVKVHIVKGKLVSGGLGEMCNSVKVLDRTYKLKSDGETLC